MTLARPACQNDSQLVQWSTRDIKTRRYEAVPFYEMIYIGRPDGLSFEMNNPQHVIERGGVVSHYTPLSDMLADPP